MRKPGFEPPYNAVTENTIGDQFEKFTGTANDIMGRVTPQLMNASTPFGKDILYKHSEDSDPHFSRNKIGHVRDLSLDGRAMSVGLILTNRVPKYAEDRGWIESFPGARTGTTVATGIWLGPKNIYSIAQTDPHSPEILVSGPEGEDIVVCGKEMVQDMPLHRREPLQRRLSVIAAGLNFLTDLSYGGAGTGSAKILSYREHEAQKPPSRGARLRGSRIIRSLLNSE